MSTAKTAMQEKLVFRNVNAPMALPGVRVLLCPDCGEALVPADIESYSACPYCGHRFELTQELEDYLLENMVNTWIHQQHMEGLLPPGMEKEFQSGFDLSANKKS